jgi:hypothetical protein
MLTQNKDDIYDFKNIEPNLNIFKINSDKDVAIKKVLEENFWNDTLNSISSIKNVLIIAYEEFSSRLRCFIECLNCYYDLKGKGLIELQKFINVFKGLTYYQFNFISESNSKSGLHVHTHHKLNNPNFVSFAMFKAYLNAIQNIFENLPNFKNGRSNNNNYEQYELYKEKLKSFCCKDLIEIESEICEHDKHCKSLIAGSKQKFKSFLEKNYARNCSSFSYSSANYIISDGKQKPTDTIADGRNSFEGYKYVDSFIIKYYPNKMGFNERTIKNICKFNDENDKSYQKRLNKIKSIHSNADDLKEYENDLYADIFGDELQHDKNMHSVISNENELDYLMIENTCESLSNLFNEDFINRNPIKENDNQLSDLLKIQNFSNDLMLNSSKDRNEVSINIYENVFIGDKTMANFANSCDKYLITDVAITTGKEAMHQQNIHELRIASLKYLAIKISEKMNQSITLNIETFDISNYFNSLCKKMSEVFYDVINTGCARVANYNATNRKYLLANKNRMITRLKELAADIQATVSTTLNKIKKEHYNKKDFFIKAMDNVIAEHSRRFKKSKLENNNKSIESEITYVKEIVNNYCSYYDMKQDIIIASSASPSLLLSSSKSSNNNNKINDDNNMSGKKRKNDELNLFIADEIKEKKTKDADGREERQTDAKKKEEEKQKKEIARKAAEDKEDEKKKKEKERKKAAEEEEKQKIEIARKAAEDKEDEKKKKEKERKKAAEEEEKQKIEIARKAAEDKEDEKKKKEKEKNDNKEIVEKAEEEHEEMDVEDEKMMNADNIEVDEEEMIDKLKMIENQLNEIENNLIDLLQKIKSTNGLERVNQLLNLVKQANIDNK